MLSPSAIKTVKPQAKPAILVPPAYLFEGRTRKLNAFERLNAGMDAYYTGEFSRIMNEFGIHRTQLNHLRNVVRDYMKNPSNLEGKWVKIDDSFLHGFILLDRLECHASYEDIRITAERLFGKKPTYADIHKLLLDDAINALFFLDGVDLSTIKAIAADEIYFGETPVFTIIDLDTTYVLAIIPMQDRKAETWQNTFEGLKRHGLNPDIAISDACGSLLNALKASFPTCNVQLDVFHTLMNLGKELSKITRKDISDLQTMYDLERRLSGPRPREDTYDRWKALQSEIDDKLDRADTIDILMGWLRELLAFPGYSEEEVKKLIEWILDCLSHYAEKWSKAMHQIEMFKKNLSEDTLKYLRQFYENLDKAAKDNVIDSKTLYDVYSLRRYSGAKYNEERLKLEDSSGWGPSGILKVTQLVEEVIAHTQRASSLVENLNSRVRVAINAERGISDITCALLTLYINTRKYPRSARKERVGKSPYELMSGEKADFFEILGVAEPTRCDLGIAG